MAALKFTIDNTGGNHGHQLKDYLGGWTIGRLFNLDYLHTPHSYLDFFGIGRGCAVGSKKIFRRFKHRSVKVISGPYWDGIANYDEMRQRLAKEIENTPEETLLVFKKAMRVHPFQTIPWLENGLIDEAIFEDIRSSVTANFSELHNLQEHIQRDSLKVAIHINRGSDIYIKNHFKDSREVRYIFPVSYFENIIDQIEEKYGRGNVSFNIYTEELNSEEIMSTFKDRPGVSLKIGSNREQKNYSLIHSIFMNFIQADILVACNSSFSAICTYFRKGKKTIYHPHKHLDYLPEPDCIKTEEDGRMNLSLL